jgi:RNA polymerase sigma-70 factor (ECF subfamily)
MPGKPICYGKREKTGKRAPSMNALQIEELKGLVSACARRDSVAFARLYRLTAPKLFGVAIRILKRDDWAEEVLQDCYLNIWRHAASYSPHASAPMTWMASIVRNRCMDWLRRPSFEVVLEPTGPDEENPLERMADERNGPLEQLALSSDAQALAACLAKLDAKQRQAIMLAFFDGLSHSELAQHMRQPLGTVKTWVRRGLERLRSCLGNSAMNSA